MFSSLINSTLGIECIFILCAWNCILKNVFFCKISEEFCLSFYFACLRNSSCIQNTNFCFSFMCCETVLLQRFTNFLSAFSVSVKVLTVFYHLEGFVTVC